MAQLTVIESGNVAKRSGQVTIVVDEDMRQLVDGGLQIGERAREA